MSEEERITSSGIDIRILKSGIKEVRAAAKPKVINYEQLTPSNELRAEGEVLRLLASGTANVDLSRRRSPMQYWHRNMDYDEVIIVIRGSAKWATDLGEFLIKVGEMLFIPRGIAHKVVEVSNDYEAIELKAAGPLEIKV